MNETVQELSRITEQPYAWLATAKERTGRRVIGCFPMYVPHEIVDAAGMLPVDLYGGSGEMTAAAEYLQTITCYPVRSVVEMLLTGKLGVLDGAIFGAICTGATSGGGIWQSLNLLPFYHQLVVPRRAGGEAVVQYFKYQIDRLQTALEAFGGRAITKGALTESIKLYNRSRSLLEQLNQVSRNNPDALPPQDFAAVRAAGSFMPRAEYAERLSRLLSQLGTASSAASSDRVKIMLVGSVCDIPQFEILSMVNEAGAVIVADDSPLGRRAWLPVAESGDPALALAQHYADLPPCPTKCDENVDPNFEYLLGLAKSSQAQGAVFLRPLYCDPLGLDYPLLSKRLNAADVPTLSLDINGREPATGQLQTRLQAFIEMLRR